MVSLSPQRSGIDFSELRGYKEVTAFLPPWDTQCETRLRMERVPVGLLGGTQGSGILFVGWREEYSVLRSPVGASEHGGGELVPEGGETTLRPT
jgi:hypothetical protein